MALGAVSDVSDKVAQEGFPGEVTFAQRLENEKRAAELEEEHSEDK